MTHTLAIDTATECVSIALLKGEAVLAKQTSFMDRGQGEALIPMIQNLLQNAGLTVSDIGSLAVSVGPGSFTGVRIGLAAARGMALALQVPIRGVTTLQAMVQKTCGKVLAVLDTKRGDYYTQFFQDAQAIEEPKIRSRAEILALNPTIIGHSVLRGTFPALSFSEPNVEPAVGVGLGCITHPLPAEPVYLREADVTC